MSTIQELTEQNFAGAVANPGVTVIDFWVPSIYEDDEHRDAMRGEELA